MKSNLRRHLPNIILVALLLVGIGLVAYPSVSDWWNQQHASRAIATYSQAVEDLTQEEIGEIRAEAEAYNTSLLGRPLSFKLSEAEAEQYASLLDVDGEPVISEVEVRSLNIDLPIYRGTEDSVLQIAIGHLEGTSLPVGGPNTHCVLVGHRGLPSAELFSKIDRMKEGDTFCLTTLGQELWYEVDQILIVEPDDIAPLAIEEGKDLCTLLTCTPYGINTHRLLVRGHRVDGPERSTLVTADAVRVEPILVASVVAVPILLVLIVIMLVSTASRRRRHEAERAAHKVVGHGGLDREDGDKGADVYEHDD